MSLQEGKDSIMQDTGWFRRLNNPWAWFCLLIVASTVRLIVAASHPLFETESYYWMYSHHFDLGYFDHPPMLGAIQNLFDFWEPPSSLAARFHSVAAHFFCSILLYGYTRNLFGSTRAGVGAALLYNVIPIYSIMAIQNQPDAPLLFFWCLLLFSFERALTTGKPVWWMLAGIAAGGALLSKFHAVPLAGSLMLHLLFFGGDRRWLTSPWPYVAGALAVVCYSPNFWWNAQNGWITYKFQLFDHAAGGEFEIVRLLGVLLAPFLLLSPWVYGYFARTVVRASKRFPNGWDRGVSLAFWSSMPLFAFFVFVSFSKTVKIHWTAPVFIGLLPLMAAGLESWTLPRRAAFHGSAGAMTVLTYLYLVYPYPLNLTLPLSWAPSVVAEKAAEYAEIDWSAHIRGFDELGAFLESKIGDRDSSGFDLIASGRFDRASIASFYAGHPDRAFVPDYGDRRGYLHWVSPYARPGANALYVFIDRISAPRREKELAELKKDYAEVGPPFEIETDHSGRTFRRFLVYPCYGLKGQALVNLTDPDSQGGEEPEASAPEERSHRQASTGASLR